MDLKTQCVCADVIRKYSQEVESNQVKSDLSNMPKNGKKTFKARED